MFGGYGQGYAGQGPSPAASKGEAPSVNNAQSVYDMFTQLQKQIPGLENIPTPKALIEQKNKQEQKEMFKGVSRSNLFVQCINRDGVEQGLKTDEQARVPSMAIFGTNKAEKNFKEFDVSLFSDTFQGKAQGYQALQQKKEEKASPIATVTSKPRRNWVPKSSVQSWQAGLMDYGEDDQDGHEGKGKSDSQQLPSQQFQGNPQQSHHLQQQQTMYGNPGYASYPGYPGYPVPSHAQYPGTAYPPQSYYQGYQQYPPHDRRGDEPPSSGDRPHSTRRSPPRQERSERRDRGRSPRRDREWSPRGDQDRSPRRERERSPQRGRQRSSRRERQRSPLSDREMSPRSGQLWSARNERERSPRGDKEWSAKREQERSPTRNQEWSPRRDRDRSPRRDGDRSPRRDGDRSPRRDRTRWPSRESHFDRSTNDDRRSNYRDTRRNSAQPNLESEYDSFMEEIEGNKSANAGRRKDSNDRRRENRNRFSEKRLSEEDFSNPWLKSFEQLQAENEISFGRDNNIKDVGKQFQHESNSRALKRDHPRDHGLTQEKKDYQTFKKPLAPSTDSKATASKWAKPSSSSSTRYSEIPPPSFMDQSTDFKDGRSKKHDNSSYRRQTWEHFQETHENMEVEEDFVNSLSQEKRVLVKKELPKKHEILLKNPPRSGQRTHLRGTAGQSEYQSERERLALTLSSALSTSSKEQTSPLEEPRKPKLGDDISAPIAKFMRTVGKSKRGVAIVAKKYHLPGNCIGLIPPRMTNEVWEILKKPTKIRDETLQDVLRWISLGIIPIVKLLDMFGSGPQPANEVCRMTSDSLTVLGFVTWNMSIKRRLLMRTALNKKYVPLCRTLNEVTQFLFGDSLARDLTDIKCGTYKFEHSKEEDNDDILSPNYKRTVFNGLTNFDRDVDDNVASMMNMACANEGDVEDLKDKYRLPQNCEFLLPAKINPEIWSLLSHSGLSLDYKLQTVQLSVAEGIVPLMKLLWSIQEGKYEASGTLEILTDALALLANSVYQLNNVRMEAMLKSLPKEVHGFVHWYWPGAEQISGEKLEQELQSWETNDAKRRAGLILDVLQSKKNQLH